MKDLYVSLDVNGIIPDIMSYKETILNGEFLTYDFGDNQVFHNIQVLPPTTFSVFLEGFLPEHDIVSHFARKSPRGQVEPNYVHSDEAHADITAILYLSEHARCGTVLYESDGITPSVTIHMKAGKALIFDSDIKHSRVLIDNYGEGNGARLVEVVFLKNKV